VTEKVQLGDSFEVNILFDDGDIRDHVPKEVSTLYCTLTLRKRGSVLPTYFAGLFYDPHAAQI
jgi:hypothetical protein